MHDTFISLYMHLFLLTFFVVVVIKKKRSKIDPQWHIIMANIISNNIMLTILLVTKTLQHRNTKDMFNIVNKSTVHSCIY